MRPVDPPPSRRATRFIAVLGLVSLSGAGTLGVEVVLARMLHRLLGSTSLSVAAVTAGFLGGMGAGALAAENIVSRLLRRGVEPLAAFAASELASLCASLLFAASAPALGLVLQFPCGEAVVVLAVMLIAAPAGASFPFVVAAIAGDGRLARRARAVYGWNAAGGAAGALVAGLVGIPDAGEWGTLLACAATQAAVAAGAVWLSRAAAARGESGEDDRASQPAPLATAASSNPTALVFAFLFVSGLLALYWEVLWTRILVLTVGSSVYSFAVIAGAVVLGIGAGSLAIGGRLVDRAGGWILPLSCAAVTVAGYFATPYLPDAYLAGVRLAGVSPIAVGALGAGAVAFLPSFLLGSLFPWALSRRIDRPGACYAFSSAGAVLGAFAGGPIGARALELEAAYVAGAAGLIFLALLGAAMAPRPRGLERFGIGALAVAAIATLAAARAGVLPRWDAKRLLSGVYQWSRGDLEGLSLAQNLASREILVVVPGREVIVSLEIERESNTVYVRGNGKVEGSVPLVGGEPSLADLPTQILLGALPSDLLAAGADRSALLIGLGSGVSLGALLGKGAPGFRPENVDVIEIEEAFLEAIRLPAARSYLAPFVPESVLSPGNGPVPRFRFGDARRSLAAECRSLRWDAIVSQPSEPWIAGAAPLFTVEFFEEAARHLKDGGVFFQWLQIYKLDWEGVRLVARTFRRVFPHVFLVRPPATGEVILLGSGKPIALERLLDAPVNALLEAARLEVPADRLAVFLLGPKGIDELAGPTGGLSVNSDSRGELERIGARSLHRSGDTARENLARLQALGGEDPISSYLPERMRRDVALLRLLASRNSRLGDFPEALAILRGDDSREGRALRESIEREARAAAAPGAPAK